AKALDLLRWSLGGLVGDMDKAGGALEKHGDSLIHAAEFGKAIGVVLAGVAGGIGVCLALAVDAIGLFVAAVTAALRGLTYGIERLVHCWNVFRDSSLGTWLLGARPKAPRQHFLINGIQDFHAAFPQQRAIAAQTMSLLPASSDPLLAQIAERQPEAKILPVNPLRDLIGSAGLNHMAALARGHAGGGPDRSEPEHAQQTARVSEMLSQTLREFTAARAAPTQMPPIQLMVDGRKMAEVVNAHNLRTARHHGEQG
ncbi:MAG: hypothetical protein AAF471_07030, partial [Myxococcota bacterium]